MGKSPQLKRAKIAPGVFAAISGEIESTTERVRERRKDLLVSWLFETAIRLQTSFDRHLKQFGMSVQEASVLFRCIADQRMTHGQVVLATGRDIRKITVFLRRLEIKGLITQGSDRKDRRLTIIRPTTQGRNLAVDLSYVFQCVRRGLFFRIRDEDVRDTERILRQLYKNAVRVGAQRKKSRRTRTAKQNVKPRG